MLRQPLQLIHHVLACVLRFVYCVPIRRRSTAQWRNTTQPIDREQQPHPCSTAAPYRMVTCAGAISGSLGSKLHEAGVEGPPTGHSSAHSSSARQPRARPMAHWRLFSALPASVTTPSQPGRPSYARHWMGRLSCSANAAARLRWRRRQQMGRATGPGVPIIALRPSTLCPISTQSWRSSLTLHRCD